jgi:succinate dehydrogenase/fumarate reductase flavoprotein subunit
MADYDVIIIGAGLGGLTAGASCSWTTAGSTQDSPRRASPWA